MCGGLIVDNTDMISNKARIIADQDWDYFLETVEQDGRPDWHLLFRCGYQCPKCGRLYIESQNPSNELMCFVPESPAKDFFSSIKGDQ